MTSATTDKLRTHLSDLGIQFREIQHEPTYTSEQSAVVRGEPLHIGGKALLVKTGDEFRIFVLRADQQFHSAAIKKELGVKKVRFATADELMELASLVPGSVPPFGRPILPFELLVDHAITENPRVAFNAGSLTCSFILSMEDYLRAAEPKVLSFARER